MSSQPTIEVLEKNLQDNMAQEVRLLRNMLTSIQEEQRAILTCNLGKWERVLEERLFPAERFQQLSSLILENTKSLCLFLNKPLPKDDTDHETTLEILSELVSMDNCEIIFLKDQILSLLQEIHQQNHLSAYFLHQQPVTHFSYTRQSEQAIKPQQSRRTKQKKLMLMDPLDL